MNKYTKNIIWLNLEKIITFVIVLGMLILTLTCATSCASKKLTMNKKTGLYPTHDVTTKW